MGAGSSSDVVLVGDDEVRVGGGDGGRENCCCCGLKFACSDPFDTANDMSSSARLAHTLSISGSVDVVVLLLVT